MSRPYRALLIAPVSDGFQGRRHIFTLPFMSLPSLAAYMPEGTEAVLVHEKHTDVDFEADVDLVGITVMTPCAPRAYEIADRFRARGIPVVLGGIHPTVKPEEALEHADAICVGEGEAAWPTIVGDARDGRLQTVYKNPNLKSRELSLRCARRDLLPVGSYFGGMIRAIFMETSRGCPYDCDFCAVTTFFGQQYRIRPVDEVEAELNAEGVKRIKPGGKRSVLNTILCFTDDNFFGNMDHAAKTLEMLRNYDVRWFGQTTLRLAEKKDMLELCRESGCLGFEIGFESLKEKQYNKTGGKKGSSQRDYYLDKIKLLHSYGMGINGSFILGNEDDDISVFQEYVDFIEEAMIQTPYLAIRTPYPGTPLYYQMKEDGRLLHEDWEKYDTAHCVFQPRRMTPEQLEAGYRWAWRKITSHWGMLRRNLFAGTPFRFWGPAALGFRMGTRSEHRGLERRHPSRLPGLPEPNDFVRRQGPALDLLPEHIQELRSRKPRAKG